MSWESVRNLRQMQRSLLLVRNILQQAHIPDEVADCLDAVSELMDEALASGEIRWSTGKSKYLMRQTLFHRSTAPHRGESQTHVIRIVLEGDLSKVHSTQRSGRALSICRKLGRGFELLNTCQIWM